MSDHRAHIKIEFSIYGKKFEWDTDLNYFPNVGDGIDDRIVDWFAECYAEARSAWDATNAAADELLKRTGVESRERSELRRLKAKYETETDNQVISLRRIQEANPILPQAHPPEPPDARASGDDFDRSASGLGPQWTDAYDGEGSGLCDMEGTSARWRDPTPSGDFTTSGITCGVCGCKVEMKAGDVVEGGDPRLCEHLGGPRPISEGRGFGFGMKAGESSPGDIAKFTVDDSQGYLGRGRPERDIDEQGPTQH